MSRHTVVVGWVEIARQIVLERFPDVRAAWLGGSTADGSATAHSDLDITVLLSGAPAPYRISTIIDGRPVEFFVQTEQSLMRFCRDDRNRRRPTTMRLVGSSQVLVDRDGSGQRLQTLLHQMDLDGPRAADPGEVESMRYAVTDLLNDLDSARTVDEALTVATALFREAADLMLSTNRRWSGSGKWLLRELRRLDADLPHAFTAELLDGLRAAAAGDTRPLHDASVSILDACGGAVFDAYRRGGHPPLQIVPASLDDAGVPELLALAVGDDDRQRTDDTLHQYRHDTSAALLLARDYGHPVGVVGYTVLESTVRILHIATDRAARRNGVGRQLLAALRESTAPHLPMVAETDLDALGFYLANDFIAESLGEKYPGVERFYVRSTAKT
jgi:GNAT superfamily N-acetyltransferase